MMMRRNQMRTALVWLDDYAPKVAGGLLRMAKARVEAANGGFSLVDEESRNGTYVRIQGEQELAHGDYLFLGKQLLRVEMTT